MKILYFFLYLWVVFALLDPDPDTDPPTQINVDPDPQPCHKASSQIILSKVAAVLGSIPAISDTVESEGWQMKQWLIKYLNLNKGRNLGQLCFTAIKYSSPSHLNINFPTFTRRR
jgi:hypothetical protein